MKVNLHLALIELVRSLYLYDPDDTVYAKKPWNVDSICILDSTPVHSPSPESLVNQGYEYFLEVRSMIELVLQSVKYSLNLDQLVRLIVHYAENDSYPDWLDEL